MTTIGRNIEKRCDYFDAAIDGDSDALEMYGIFSQIVSGPEHRQVPLYRNEINNNFISIVGDVDVDDDLQISIVVSPDREFVARFEKSGIIENDMPVSGTCGLSGLIAISAQIPDIIEWARRIGLKTVTAIPIDEKRAKAYRWLLQLGFIWENEEFVFQLD